MSSSFIKKPDSLSEALLRSFGMEFRLQAEPNHATETET